MPRASYVPPDPARQDWGVFEPPNSLDPPQDIAGETEDERRKEAFKNVMRAVSFLYETDPRGLFDLVRLLGREEQSHRMALPLSFPGDVNSGIPLFVQLVAKGQDPPKSPRWWSESDRIHGSTSLSTETNGILSTSGSSSPTPKKTRRVPVPRVSALVFSLAYAFW